MATIPNKKFNPNLPESATNQRFIFDQPTIVNQETGQFAQEAITGEMLTPTPTIDFQTPQFKPTPAFPIVPESKPIEPTSQETEISKAIRRITETADIGAEKEAFSVEEEKRVGLEALKSVEEDYTAQLRQIEADYKNIPLKVQEEFTGRAGITQQQLISESEQRRMLMRAKLCLQRLY